MSPSQPTDAPLRVVFVTPKAVLGGAERWLLAMLDGTRRIQSAVVCLESGPLVQELATRGVPTFTVPTGAGAADVAAAAVRMRSILRDVDPDVVVANGIKAALSVVPQTFAAGIPSVWVRHDVRFSDSLGPVVARLADAVVFVAPPDEDEERDFRPVYLPPPLLAEPLAREQARSQLAELGVPVASGPLLGMMTRLVPQKGVDTAIEALAGAPGWQLVVAGTPDPAAGEDEDSRLRALAGQRGVSDRVTFLGHVEGAGRLAAGFDAIAVLTRPGGKGYPETEGYPISLIEAHAAGVPVLGDPRRIPPFRLPEVAAGMLPVDSEDPDDVARGLRALEDPGVSAGLQAAAAASGRNHPRGPDTSEALVDVLAGLCHRPGAGLTGGPAISVVSTVKNEGAHAEALVGMLLAQAGPNDRVVIVDGGSEDDTVARLSAIAERDGRLHVIEAPGAGISAGRNIGIDASTTEWIACTDAGCEPDPGWLDALREAAQSGEADLITGTYRASYGDHRLWEIALAHVAYPNPEELRRRTPLVRLYGKAFGRTYDASLPTGRSVAFRKSTWRAAGGYPEDLATAEDVMFGRNAIDSGARAVLCADACVTWDQRPTLKSNARMFRGYGRGDGQSGDKQLIGRDLARAAAYVVGPAMLLNRRTRPLALAGFLAYVSLPLVRAARGPRPAGAIAMVPVAAAVRDVAKAVGCIDGLTRHRNP